MHRFLGVNVHIHVGTLLVTVHLEAMQEAISQERCVDNRAGCRHPDATETAVSEHSQSRR